MVEYLNQGWVRDNGYFKYKTVFFDSYNGFTGQQSRLINQMFIDADDVYASFDYSLNHTDDEFHLFSNIVNTVNQLKQMGAFDKIQGLILGTFSKMQENNISPTIEELAIKIINNPNLPIAKTEEIGHGANSKCIVIGKTIILK